MSATFLSPVVKRLLAEHRLESSSIQGTGADGRITKKDVLGVLQTRGSAAGSPSSPATASVTPDAQPATMSDGSVGAPMGEPTVVPFSPIRRAIAEHMVRSIATSAHTLVVIEVDYNNVDRVRRPAKDAFRDAEGFGLTYLPFIALATAAALREYPEVNSTIGHDADERLELRIHPEISLGIAVDLDFKGLVVPVMRNVGAMGLTAMARSITDVAERALARKLTNDDLVGGTFTITNAGGFDTLMTGPIINQPQVAILSTDGVKVRPVAVPNPTTGGHDLAFHPVGNLALSFDHRAFDGAYASAFLANVRHVLENQDWQEELDR